MQGASSHLYLQGNVNNAEARDTGMSGKNYGYRNDMFYLIYPMHMLDRLLMRRMHEYKITF